MSTFNQSWVDQTKILLLANEQQNVETRAQRFADIVNQRTTDIHNQVFGINAPLLERYQYKGALSPHDLKNALQFLRDWEGLKRQPVTYNKYLLSARNWLSGRRAKGCAETLFPLLIHKAEQFAHHVAQNRFRSQKLSDLYFSILMYAYLQTMMESKVRIANARKVWLLCENSLSSPKTTLMRILQSYAQTSAYPETFPAHRGLAIDYFRNQMELNKKELLQLMRKQNKPKKKAKPQHIHVEIKPFNDIMGTIQQMLHNQQQQQLTMADLAGRVATIEEKVNVTNAAINTRIYFNQNMK